MKLPRRKPSDEELMSWLETGAPGRVDKLLDDPNTAQRLERLTALREHHVATLHELVKPTHGFAERTEIAVKTRVSDLERIGTLFSLLGLGPQTARTLSSNEEPA